MSGLVPDNVTVAGVPAAQAPAPAALTPTQQVIAGANAIVFGVDKRGRQIGVRRLKLSDRRRVMKTVSADTAAKPTLLGYYIVAACCAQIDSDPVPFPENELQNEGIQDRLGDEGMEAVGTIFAANFAQKEIDPKN